MKTKSTLIPAAVACATVLQLAAIASQARYDSELSHDAHRIESIAHELRDEFRSHYRHVRAYHHMQSDILEVISKVRHIERLSHHPHSSLPHIAAGLRTLDRMAHDLHALVDDVEDGRDRRYVEGDTRHVHSLLSSLNSTIHSMESTVEEMRHGDHDDHEPEDRRERLRDTARELLGIAL